MRHLLTSALFALFAAFGLFAGPASASLGQYPTSQKAPVGKTLENVGLFPFKGGTRDACEKLELMPGECEELVRLINSNQCAVRDIPEEGIVVDRALFTVDGKHRVRDRLHIKPNDPAMRPSRVCYLGTGTVVIWLYKCNNYNVVYNWHKSPVATARCGWHPTPRVPVYRGGASYGWILPGFHTHVPGRTIITKEWVEVCPDPH